MPHPRPHIPYQVLRPPPGPPPYTIAHPKRKSHPRRGQNGVAAEYNVLTRVTDSAVLTSAGAHSLIVKQLNFPLRSEIFLAVGLWVTIA